VGEGEDAGDRVRSLGAGRGIVRQALELVVLRGVVLAQSEQPGDDLRTEARRGAEARLAGRARELRGRVLQAERSHELGVQPRHRHRRARGVHRSRRLLCEPGDELGRLAAREDRIGAEGRDARGHQARADDGLDLRVGPVLRGRVRARGRKSGQAGEQGGEEQQSAAHPIRIVGSRAAL
jgi:hypothetical protein